MFGNTKGATEVPEGVAEIEGVADAEKVAVPGKSSLIIYLVVAAAFTYMYAAAFVGKVFPRFVKLQQGFAAPGHSITLHANKMFFIPMIFMLAATLTSLIITIIKKIGAMAAGAQNAFFWGNWFQLIFALAMAVLAVILVIEGIQTFARQAKAKK